MNHGGRGGEGEGREVGGGGAVGGGGEMGRWGGERGGVFAYNHKTFA